MRFAAACRPIPTADLAAILLTDQASAAQLKAGCVAVTPRLIALLCKATTTTPESLLNGLDTPDSQAILREIASWKAAGT